MGNNFSKSSCAFYGKRYAGIDLKNTNGNSFWKDKLMTLGIRKIIVISLIGLVFLAGNILLIANWLAEKGIEEKANWIREHFLTGTAVTIILVLLTLLVSPRKSSSKIFGFVRRCPICDHRLLGKGDYCCDCGSKVS